MADEVTYTVDPLYRCWLWSGRVDRDGYGILWGARARPVYAHKAVYERERGPVPEGLQLDHLCRRRLCVNPAHLEAVKPTENQRRKRWGRRSRVVTCPMGHDMTMQRLRTPEGGVLCRVCNTGR